MLHEKIEKAIDESITNFIQDYDIIDSLYNRINVLTLMIKHWDECPDCVDDPEIEILIVLGAKKLFIMKSELALMN